MKQTKIAAFLALAFILGVATPVVGMTVANNVSAAEQAESGSIVVSDTATFVRSINDNDITTITLGSNIQTMGLFQINRTTPLTINLAGYNITASSNHGLQIERGNITIIGTGEIYGRSNGSAINVLGSSTPADNYTVVTIGTDVKLKSDNMYGIAVVDRSNNGKAYGVVVNLSGKIDSPYGITINGRINDATNAPVINIKDGAVINTTSRDSSLPIYAAGYANWNVGAATLTSQAAVAMKAGKATFTNTNITVDGVRTSPEVSNNGVNGLNSVFQVEHNNSYAGNVSINVNGGSYVSKKGNVFYEYNLAATTHSAADINITGGTFTAAAGKSVFGGDGADVDIQISGGTFSGSDIASFKENGYLASGYEINESGVVAKPTISGGSSVSSGSSSSKNTLSSVDGAVTVSGDLNGAVKFDVKPVEKQIAAFGKNKVAIYDMTLTNIYGDSVKLTESVTVSVVVPSFIDGTKAQIYYIDENNAVEKLASRYADGVITFSTTHFSLYAIVEEVNAVVVGNENQVPNTGVISSQGIINAIGTTLPLLIMAGIAFVWFNRHMVKVRRAERLVEEERERIAKAYIPKVKREATVDHFVATPIEHHDQDGPMVDMFVK